MPKHTQYNEDQFCPSFIPMRKQKEYDGEEQKQWKRQIKKQYATNKEIRNHKRAWQE